MLEVYPPSVPKSLSSWHSVKNVHSAHSSPIDSSNSVHPSLEAHSAEHASSSSSNVLASGMVIVRESPIS
jgi:hypothetical protein